MRKTQLNNITLEQAINTLRNSGVRPENYGNPACIIEAAKEILQSKKSRNDKKRNRPN